MQKLLFFVQYYIHLIPVVKLSYSCDVAIRVRQLAKLIIRVLIATTSVKNERLSKVSVCTIFCGVRDSSFGDTERDVLRYDG